MNLNIKAVKQNTYDVIVVGSGISGGWAAKEFTQKGLKTLLIERGRKLEHIKDYTTAMLPSWELPHHNQTTQQNLLDHPTQSKSYAFNEGTKHFWVNDNQHAYEQEKPFDWIRGYHLGGKSLMWGRHSYRFSDLDFEANLREGIGVDWPVRYKELAPWYSYVEKFVGISGQNEGFAQLPDGDFLPAMPLNCVEDHFIKNVKKAMGRDATMGRIANLSQQHNGRGPCQHRNLCARGCPFSGYFSTLSATLPAAVETGNLTIRTDSIVSGVLYDENTKKAKGVSVIDALSGEKSDYFAKIVFLNASTLGTTFILMNSVSDRFPNSLGNDSGELGHNLMDHHHMTGASGEIHDYDDKYYFGRRPGGFYIPRFRNLDQNNRDYIRGFGYQGAGSRDNWQQARSQDGFGAEFKNAVTKPGSWRLGIQAFGEMLPYHENHVRLDDTKKDEWGLPQLVISCEYKDNELAMRKDMRQDAIEMLEATGFKNITSFDNLHAPGLTIHEMGTARMGKDPKTSVLNGNNQLHAVKNVFVTDGACMTSSACQNPSLTYMALTARACDFAMKEMKAQRL
ncbi:GMC oxidoreductase [Dyadobacter psychrotolerans]|uniref:GMC family oxidoreductase n=1 Tax=Dyadobacter psychrotolerans TaxID=2541721 RepID=A0A4R5DPI0_9BACT|nr:GMC family oxidoreductase [Dyadobacter psychrotolerans]TDE15487.1 GMC family oxidoreductase [Dyadobacter psychrotolerans]